MRFSQRMGITPVRDTLQVESMDLDLKNRLWNTFLDFFRNTNDITEHRSRDSIRGQICKTIWQEFFKKPVDEIPLYSDNFTVFQEGFLEFLKNWFYKAPWYSIYDFIEFVVIIGKVTHLDYTERFNQALEKEVAGYRVIEYRIVQITSESEIKAIEESIQNTDKWKSVNTHLRAALNFLADRKVPNYRNSIKESISAVESFCKIITNDDKATLGKALSEIEKKHTLHNALKSSFSALYGFTSDAGGIRHALLETDVKIEFEDAKFMLVSCSAFINYLKAMVRM